MFTHVQCCDIVPSLVSSFGESLDIGLYFAPQLPRGFDHFYGAGRGGEPPPPHSAGRGGEPPPPRGEGSPRGGAPIPDSNTKLSHPGAIVRSRFFGGLPGILDVEHPFNEHWTFAVSQLLHKM